MASMARGKPPEDYPVERPGRDPSISPTDISSFIRLDQCRRYLRLRLHQHAYGNAFLQREGVRAQALQPLLSKAGRAFEQHAVDAVAAAFPLRDMDATRADPRAFDNDRIVVAAERLAPGQTLILSQPRIDVALGTWRIQGAADLIRFARDDAGRLSVLTIDIKSSRAAKVEHRLQVAFYDRMLAALFAERSIVFDDFQAAILYRGLPYLPESAGADDLAKIQADRERAFTMLNVADAFLEEIDDLDAYRAMVGRMVTESGSIARQAAAAPFEELPFALSAKCDDCLFGEFCLRWSAERDDLTLVPGLTVLDRQSLRECGVVSTRQLATLERPRRTASGGLDLRSLEPDPAQAATVERLRRSRMLGPRLDELIYRARKRTKVGGRPLPSPADLPGKGYSSLPACTPDLHPNLIRIYLDAQYDYLTQRLYLLGALVSAAKDGVEDASRQRVVIEMTPEPPESDAAEQALLERWVQGVLEVVARVVQPDADGQRNAPIHLIVWSQNEQHVLLDALARHAERIFGATSLFDFVTQLAGFDSPVVTHLADETRRFKNYPLMLQTLQKIAQYLKFDWGEFKKTFRTRMFDDDGKLEHGPDGPSEWITLRPRFRSQIPLEYAYGAWRRLPDPKPREKDRFQDFADIEPEELRDFEERRLYAMEWIARNLRPNPDTTKTSFSVPDLASFSDHRPGLARALYEFIMVERHVALAEWRTERNAEPEQRTLAGVTLLGRYREADQNAATREANRRHAALQADGETRLAVLRQADPAAHRKDLPKADRDATNWNAQGMTVRLRLTAEGTGLDLADLLAATSLRDGERALIALRWNVDSRLPTDQQVQRAATPKQLLFRGMRGDLEGIDIERDAEGRFAGALARFQFGPSFGGKMAPFVYGGHPEPLTEGTLYTIEPDPNDWTGYWARSVINGLREGHPNTLFARLAGAADDSSLLRVVPPDGQLRFLAGLDAMWEREGREPLTDATREYIAGFGHDPLLLVQGPPGAGKSFTTALAVLAHLQASLAADMPCRVIVSANTHAATDVVLGKLLDAQAALRAWRERYPDLFARWFDPRLLDVPFYRFDPKATTPAGALPLFKKERRTNGLVPLDVLKDARHCVIAAVTNGVYSLAKERVKNGSFFAHACVDCLVLDEASRMSLPDGIMAALPLTPEAPIVVVGDHRQMQPIRKHNWDDEPHRTFRDYAVYESLFDTLQGRHAPTIRFDRSYRLHKEMAECLRDLIYRRDGIPFHSRRDWTLRDGDDVDAFVHCALDPAYPMVVVTHDEAGSLKQNEFEGVLVAPLFAALLARGYDVRDGFGVVVPHRAQRALLRDRLRATAGADAADDAFDEAVDTVERFQGGERDAIIISATESDPAYLLEAGEFLFDPSRLTVALSRARQKMILVAARSVFDLFSPDEHLFQNTLLWKNLLRRTCNVSLWNGTIEGHTVQVWGNQSKLTP